LLGDRTKVSANLLVEGDVSTVTMEGKQSMLKMQAEIVRP